MVCLGDEPGRTAEATGGVVDLRLSVVFSILGFDLAMALSRTGQRLFGIYFFISGLYLAVGGWTLAHLVDRGATPDQWHDQSDLIITFSMLTTYMMYSQLC